MQRWAGFGIAAGIQGLFSGLPSENLRESTVSHLHQVLFSCSPLSSLVNVHFVFELLSGPEPLRLLMPFAGEKQFKLIPGMFHLFDEKPRSLDFEESSETTGSDW